MFKRITIRAVLAMAALAGVWGTMSLGAPATAEAGDYGYGIYHYDYAPIYRHRVHVHVEPYYKLHIHRHYDYFPHYYFPHCH